jgi:hypothetical protein
MSKLPKLKIVVRRTILLCLTLSWIILLINGIKAYWGLVVLSALVGVVAFERPPPNPEYLIGVTIFILLYLIFWGGIFYTLYRLLKLWIKILKQFW